jgi:hypothetical protein
VAVARDAVEVFFAKAGLCHGLHDALGGGVAGGFKGGPYGGGEGLFGLVEPEGWGGGGGCERGHKVTEYGAKQMCCQNPPPLNNGVGRG